MVLRLGMLPVVESIVALVGEGTIALGASLGARIWGWALGRAFVVLPLWAG